MTMANQECTIEERREVFGTTAQILESNRKSILNKNSTSFRCKLFLEDAEHICYLNSADKKQLGSHTGKWVQNILRDVLLYIAPDVTQSFRDETENESIARMLHFSSSDDVEIFLQNMDLDEMVDALNDLSEFDGHTIPSEPFELLRAN